MKEPPAVRNGSPESGPALSPGATAEGPPTAPVPARRRIEPAAWFALALLAVVWSWWALKEGAWFGVVFLPGAMLLCAGLVVLAWTAPWRGTLRLSWSTAVALVALFALGAWAALSAAWSPAPDVAIADGQRVAVYAVAFAVGIWTSALLRPRHRFAAAPLAIAGVVAGAATVHALLTGDTPRDYLEVDGTLEFPIGYRNANAAFFAIAFFPALGLAADRRLSWPLRGAALGAATLCIDLAMLSQSRATVPAAAIALIVFLAASSFRLRALVWTVLAAAPAILMLPAVVDLYEVANEQGLRFTIDELRATGRMALVTVALATALGLVGALVERRLPEPKPLRLHRPWLVRGAVGVAVVVALAAGAIALKPVDFVSDRVDEFAGGGYPGFSGETRFQVTAQTNRSDTWRVALADFRENPVAGLGAGGYHYSYVRQREATRTVRDAHSVQLEILSELGIVGLALFVLALGGATAGALRARRKGPSVATLTAVALGSGAYWLAHASVDWFWAYPALTAPMLALLGAACAPALLTPSRRRLRRKRPLIAGASALLALTLVPPFLSERYVNEAYAGWRADLSRAYDDLDRARAMNPLSDRPLLAEGAIAAAAGERRRAISAFREAARKRPEEWATHFLLAELHARDRPALARRKLEQARDRNPISSAIDELEARLDASD